MAPQKQAGRLGKESNELYSLTLISNSPNRWSKSLENRNKVYSTPSIINEA